MLCGDSKGIKCLRSWLWVNQREGYPGWPWPSQASLLLEDLNIPCIREFRQHRLLWSPLRALERQAAVNPLVRGKEFCQPPEEALKWTFLSWAFRQGCSPAGTWISASWDSEKRTQVAICCVTIESERTHHVQAISKSWQWPKHSQKLVPSLHSYLSLSDQSLQGSLLGQL